MKSQVSGPEKFEDLLFQISALAGPVLDAVLNESDFVMIWSPGGPWKKMV